MVQNWIYYTLSHINYPYTYKVNPKNYTYTYAYVKKKVRRKITPDLNDGLIAHLESFPRLTVRFRVPTDTVCSSTVSYTPLLQWCIAVSPDN